MFVVLGFYISDVFVLPIRTVDVLLTWYLPHFTRYASHTFISFITDIVGYGLHFYLAATYTTNYVTVFNLFITDSIGKLKQ